MALPQVGHATGGLGATEHTLFNVIVANVLGSPTTTGSHEVHPGAGVTVFVGLRDVRRPVHVGVVDAGNVRYSAHIQVTNAELGSPFVGAVSARDYITVGGDYPAALKRVRPLRVAADVPDDLFKRLVCKIHRVLP
jgi:hypothetical protein